MPESRSSPCSGLRLNGDLVPKARSLGINVSPVAEAAPAEALRSRLAEVARTAIKQDMGAYTVYVEQHGSPAEMLRGWLAKRDDAT